ncbi:dihydroorotate dehydrogenase-like protein [candidate division KSB1 bacterium]|nr:dihydroorotate dehydrogenase-like protein [candidate division KSB1 bacterium]
MNLSVRYMGLDLKNPLVASPSPFCEHLDKIEQMVSAGASAIVLHSLFEEQLRAESEGFNRNLMAGTESFAEALSYFPDLDQYKLNRDDYLTHIQNVKKTVDVPIIGSLNGVSSGGWIEYAKEIESAGADGIELNIYFMPTDPASQGHQVEQLYVQLVKDITESLMIPVAVKVSPYFSAPANFLSRLDQAGSDALVIFNRFYQPDIDLENLEIKADVLLSHPDELRLRLRWAAVLSPIIDADIAITGGVHTSEDVLKSMMVGAKVAMMTSAVLQNGPGYFKTVLDGIIKWMEKHDYDSIQQMQGTLNYKNVKDPAAFERANYMKILGSWRD